METGDEAKRPYRSGLRRSQTASTRRLIVAAAAQLFAELGYVRTTIDEIAAAAGVGRATVFTAAGGKPELLRQAYDTALRGAGSPTPAGARSSQAAGSASRGALLEEYARQVTAAAARTARVYVAIRDAASADADVRALREEIDAERQREARATVDALIRIAPPGAGWDAGQAADVVWALTDPGLYVALVHARGWRPEDVAAWLASTLQEQLLGPAG
jgi:AcrR family transcriptional regulator